MKRIMILVLGIVGFLMCDAGYEPQITQIIYPVRTPINPYQTEYEQMLYPTVRISSPSGVGSGVMIDVTRVTKGYNSYKGYILTAAHVVDNQNTVNIELYNSTVITASVVITDTAKDLALLGISHSSLDIYVARLAPKDYTPYIFTPVYSVGCSLGLAPRPSAGIITAINKDSWEVSSPILPGNSGGPVYDAKTYQVIGIAVWVHTYNNQLVITMAGVIPINQIYEFLNHR